MNRRKRRFVDPTNENFRRKGTRSLSAVVDDAANSFSGTTTSNTRAAPISSVTDGTTFELHDRTTVERGSASTFSSSNDFGGTGARLYVGNLDVRVSEGDILKIFSHFGTIAKCDFLWNHEGPRRGRPRGFCFVEMSNRSEAIAAINDLNGRLLKGRRIAVNVAREDGTERRRETTDFSGETDTPSDKVEYGKEKSTVLDTKLERRALLVKQQLKRMKSQNIDAKQTR